MRLFKFTFVVVMFLAASALKVAGQDQFIAQQLDNKNGLSNSCINYIFQDSDNLLWIGTWDGLNYFDGTNVHVFNFEKTNSQSSSIASNIIYQIDEDKKRNIWIGTVEGLSKFNKNTGSFSNYFYNQNIVESNGYVTAINNNGTVFAACRNTSHVLRYDEKKDTFTNVTLPGLGNFMLQRLSVDAHNNLWILTDKNLLVGFRPSAGKFIPIPGYVVAANVDNIFYVNKQLFYVDKSHQLFRVEDNYSSQALATLPHQVRAMSYFKDHYVIGWASKGVSEYDNEFKASDFLSADIPELRNMRITSLKSDDGKILWLGTDGDGVMKVIRKENYFGLVQQQGNGQQFHIPVRAFCEVDNALWIGTKGNGILTLKNWDSHNVSFSSINSFHTNVDLLDNCVYSIVKGQDGLIYIGSDAPGVTIYDKIHNKFIKWDEIKGSKLYPSFGSVHCILFDTDNSVWLGLNDAGLIHLKLFTGKDGSVAISYLQHYKHTGQNTGPANDVIYSLAKGSNNRLWIGCRFGGLSYLDINTGKFTTLKAFSYNNSLSNNDVLSLYIDHKNRLWVGTSFGLNWIDEAAAASGNKPAFKTLYVENGLPNNTIHAINEDGAGNIWISTNKGLAKINPTNSKIVIYKESDGLQSDEFSDNAVWKNPKGMLFFGGIYGFNYFMPQNIHIDNEQPRLLISDLQFAGRNFAGKGLYVLTKKGAVSNQHFDLKPSDNYFELSVQPITYINQQKCLYAYKLDGDDHTWHYMSSHDKIIYNNLQPGNYTLKIKWSNGEGSWTDGITVFSVTVNQYFWLTSAAYAIYALIFLGAAWLYIRYRKNKYLMRQELKMEHLLREKDEELHNEQLNFFTNIAHELQTPLTLISVAIERFFYKSGPREKIQHSQFLSIVDQESSRLTYLVQQLMEFRKAESGSLQLYVAPLNITMLLNNICDLFEPMVEHQQINFNRFIENDIVLRTDKDKLEKIVFNLLSNAFKHSPKNEKIVVACNYLAEDKQLELVIANSGCFLSAHEISHIFDKFYTQDGVPDKTFSTGIGLAFTRELVNLLQGTIAVSLENQWITFKLTLPCLTVHEQPADELSDKTDNPSELLQSIIINEPALQLADVNESNKSAMFNSLANKDEKSILVVEDEQSIRYLLKDLLCEYYTVYEAENGRTALELLKNITPDLIICDVMMPDMNGLELCKIIKTTPKTCHIPFIILSAKGTTEQKSEGYEAGADAYIPKPFRTDYLLVRVRKLINYQQRLHELFASNHYVSDLSETGINPKDKKFLEKTMRAIEDHIDMEDMDSAFLEENLGISRMQLYRKLKSLCNMTPAELIKNVRLEFAAGLLVKTELSVSEIFYKSGFNNQSYFYREFKKKYSLSPNAYRANFKSPVA